MFAVTDIGDWVQGIVILIIVVGSALSGLAQAIMRKLNKQPTIEPPEESRRRAEPRPVSLDRPVPPVARPMPPPTPRRRVVVRTQTSTGTPAPVTERKAEAEFEVAVPEVVRPFVKMLLENAGAEEPLESAPATPPPPPRVQRPRPQRPPQPVRSSRPTAPAVTEREARMRDIEEREARQAQRVERRIGHVETHVAPVQAETATRSEGAAPFDRQTLRRAIVLSEILGPPVALRGGADR